MEKEEIKLSLFADNMTLYIENPRDATSKWLELVSELGKAARYKINMQKSVAFLYTNKDQKEKLKKQSHLLSHQKCKIPRNKPT